MLWRLQEMKQNNNTMQHLSVISEFRPKWAPSNETRDVRCRMFRILLPPQLFLWAQFTNICFNSFRLISVLSNYPKKLLPINDDDNFGKNTQQGEMQHTLFAIHINELPQISSCFSNAEHDLSQVGIPIRYIFGQCHVYGASL